MIRRYGIDTSVLVRLLCGEPEVDFAYCVDKLSALIESAGAEIFASNQVIGEAYIAVQHHYGVTKTDARAGLIDVLRSGLVEPLNGHSVYVALESSFVVKSGLRAFSGFCLEETEALLASLTASSLRSIRAPAWKS